MSKVYLAAPFARQAEMRKIREQLHGLDCYVTSRWLDERESPLKPPEQAAYHDLADIAACDTFIQFTNPPANKHYPDGLYMSEYNPRGGMHVEFGYALARGKEIWVVGYRENIFHHLLNVRFFKSWAQVMAEVYGIKVVA